jgi:hypothetical protein
MKGLLQPIAMLFVVLICGCTPTGYRNANGVVSFITWDEGHGRREHPVAGADPSSFQVLDKQGYAKDRSSAYFRWTRMEGADPASLIALSELYARDRQSVFYEGRIVPGADPSTFAIFDVQWARDAADVYLQNRPIQACDPATFVMLEKDWQRDSRCVYNRGRKLANADPKTFSVLNFWYGKDARNVYHNDARPLAGADAKTFVIAKPCEICGQDDRQCYRYSEVVPCKTDK